MDIRHSSCSAFATRTTRLDQGAGIWNLGPFRAGFTLIEMLTVIVLISILMTAAGLSVRKARQLAKNTKAEAECRELVNAMLEYRATYGGWPNDAKGELEVSYSFLKPLIDGGSNPRGIVFLNLSLTSGDWRDPWGSPYKVHIPADEKTKRPAAIETCVSFPFRNTAP